MLSDLELQLIKDFHNEGLGLNQQDFWLSYPVLQDEVRRATFPEQLCLRQMNEQMNLRRVAYDVCYSHFLLPGSINPLRVEQKAWLMLSPSVAEHVSDFGGFVNSYSPKSADQRALLTHIEAGLDVLQQWEIIDRSFGAKYTTAKYRGTPGFEDIYDRLWMADINAKEEQVSSLMHDMQKSVRFRPPFIR
jgi:hypothetical protein